MAKPLVSDELWAIIEPHIPVKERRKCHAGRKPLPDHACLTGILFVLRSGVPWKMLPQEMGGGSGMTGWRRLRDWKEAGVWRMAQGILLIRCVGPTKSTSAVSPWTARRSTQLGRRTHGSQPRRP